ncbi:MAG: hypothetical protein K0B16_18555, partial [Burkholderiaceae bacterium]|nr:hypothetical protein [Burkholderiaceae bacterium]
MAGKPWISPSNQSPLTSSPDQVQIPMLGDRRQRISTTFETRPTLVPQVKLRKRLDLARDAERAVDGLPGRIVAGWGKS